MANKIAGSSPRDEGPENISIGKQGGTSISII